MLFRSIQQFDVMDGRHGTDLLDLRFQGNAPVGLLICRNPHVTDRLSFHILKKLDHTSGSSHKLSGYPTRLAWVCETPAGPWRRITPPAHGGSGKTSNGLGQHSTRRKKEEAPETRCRRCLAFGLLLVRPVP